MTLTFHLSVVTPHGKAFDGRAEFLSLIGASGSLGVLAGHAPMFTTVKPGVLLVRAGGKDSFFAVQEGIVEVLHNHDVVVLIDEALPAPNEDSARTLLLSQK